MTQDELLDKLKLKDDELKDLINKFGSFRDGLNDAQRAVVKRSLPTLCEALSWLGPHATEAELRKLFGGSQDNPPIIVCHFAGTDRL